MTNSTTAVLELLELGLNRVRRGWTQFSAARKANGVPCDPAASTAVEWCTTGAVSTDPDAPADRERALVRHKALAALSAVLPDITPLDNHRIRLTNWNDATERTQADCIGLYESAIAHERTS